MNYYNDNDGKVAAWLRQLVRKNRIARGYVDERSIRDINASELGEYAQCHFFAGIGGWPYALRLAGWPDDVPVWTGSCPCQPLSCAGQRKGEMDDRHLWPEFYRIIAECRPATIFGEQVASSDGLEWLDGISLDLEDLDYAIAAADLPGACVGSPHRRQRLFWVAYSESLLIARTAEQGKRIGEIRETGATDSPSARRSCTSEYRRTSGWQQSLCDERNGRNETVGDSAISGPQKQWREYRPGGKGCSGLVGLAMQAGVPQWNGPTIAIKCSDGTRRVSAQPGSFPLANGIPARMVRLRAYGNAIIPQVAAKFITAFMQSLGSGANAKNERNDT